MATNCVEDFRHDGEELQDYDAAIARLEREAQRLREERDRITKVSQAVYLTRLNTNEFFPWELNEEGGTRFPHEVHNRIHHSLESVTANVEYDTKTGECKILSVVYGKQRLVPEDSE